MAIELNKNTISINQIIANKTEKAVIEGDCIVPDVKPDILELIGTSGVINVYKKEVSDGKVRIDGCVCIYIMYLGDDGKGKSVRSINHTLDFSQIIGVENATGDMNECGEVSLKSIDCKIINERKINIKANLNFGVKIFANSNIEFVDNINLKDMQKLEKKLNVNSVLGIGSTKTNAKENIAIDTTNNLAEILKVNARISNEEIKASYNKLLTKADVKIKIMYSTDDNRINVAKATLPIMGFIDMQDITENNVVEPEFEIKNMIIKPNGTQDHSISVDVEVGINVVAYQSKEINVIQDLYSPSTNLNFEKKNAQTLQNKSMFRNTCNVSQRELLDIGDEKVYDVDISVVPNDIKVHENEIEIAGNVNCTFTYSTNGMTGISNKKIEFPIEYRMPCKGIEQNATVQLKYDIANENFNILPSGEVDMKFDINFVANSSNIVNISLVDNITEDNNKQDDKYNMVIYFTRPQDNLWEVAKKFKSTTKNIMETNELKNETLLPGTQLFISKYTV